MITEVENNEDLIQGMENVNDLLNSVRTAQNDVYYSDVDIEDVKYMGFDDVAHEDDLTTLESKCQQLGNYMERAQRVYDELDSARDSLETMLANLEEAQETLWAYITDRRELETQPRVGDVVTFVGHLPMAHYELVYVDPKGSWLVGVVQGTNDTSELMPKVFTMGSIREFVSRAEENLSA